MCVVAGVAAVVVRGPGCGAPPWVDGPACQTKVSNTTVDAGYITSELGNRSIAWLQELDAEDDDRPWFLYFAPHAPHMPASVVCIHRPQPTRETVAFENIGTIPIQKFEAFSKR